MPQELEKFILTNFHDAMAAGHILPYYQPVVRTMSRRLCSMEALARWADPEHGLIQPDQFIPVLERHALIHLLDECVVRQVCARMRQTMNAGGDPTPCR